MSDDDRSGPTRGGDSAAPGAGEPERARVRRVGCLVGLVALALAGATVAWKSYLMLTSR